MKVQELILNLPPSCAYCKSKKSCEVIKELNKYLDNLKIKITKNAKIKYNKNRVFLRGDIGQEKGDPMLYWIELKVTDKKVRGVTTMTYIPFEDGYVCSEMEKKHEVSYF